MNNTAHYIVINLGKEYESGSVIEFNWWSNSGSNRQHTITQVSSGTYNPSGGANDLVVNYSDTAGTGSFNYTLDATTRYIQVDMTDRSSGRIELLEATITTEVTMTAVDVDTDGDGIPDRLDLDSDNDGIADIVEAGGTDTDSNGDPDRIDLDSDGDECSDANEYYELSNADGGDDGEFGTGTPSVDANGLVIAASYNGDGITNTKDDTINICTADLCDPLVSGNLDTDGDGISDVCDLDSDNDGILDVNECLVLSELNYEFYDGAPSGYTVDNIPTTGADQIGAISDFDVTSLSTSITGSAETFSIRYTGLIQISASNTYTFYTTSYDGSKLFINGIEVVDNDGLHAAQEESGTISLTAGIHDIEILFFENTGAQNLSVSYESDTISKTTLPFSILSSYCDTDSDGVPDYLDLDSDGDGCGDANEYYESNTADADGNGTFGSGNPTVDSDGLVIAAGYDGTALVAVTDDNVIRGCTFIQDVTGDWSTA